MTQATDLAYTARRSSDTRLIASVSAAHFVSHFYMLALPPLFAYVRADYGVSYTEIGLALAVMNIVSAVLQTPAGFLVDRMDARIALVIGLLLGSIAFAVSAAVDSYWVLIAMFGLLGVGNTVYHPANYVLLSHGVSTERMSQAYSVHTFAGMLGSAAAPVSMLFVHSLFGWRGAFYAAAILGFISAAILFLQRRSGHDTIHADHHTQAQGANWELLLSPPILMAFLFFMLIATAHGGLQAFSVVALGALHGTPAITANAALSANLILLAIGVLIGGWIAGRTPHHGLVASLGLAASGLTVISLGLVNPSEFMIIALMSFAGLCSGTMMTSRDMLVRSITPPGAFGKVFGFVTNGFNFAGIIAPLFFGALMDHGSPRAVFVLIGVCSLAAVATVMCTPKARSV